jgi:hypothetical protein
MKSIIPVFVTTLSAIALLMSYASFTAVGQSSQASRWEVATSAALATVAWKINKETGDAYYCNSQQSACLHMKDQ